MPPRARSEATLVIGILLRWVEATFRGFVITLFRVLGGFVCHCYVFGVGFGLLASALVSRLLLYLCVWF